MQCVWGPANELQRIDAAFRTAGRAGRLCDEERARRRYCNFKKTLMPLSYSRNNDPVYWQQTIEEEPESLAGCAGSLSKAEDNMWILVTVKEELPAGRYVVSTSPVEHGKDRIESTWIDSVFPRQGAQKKEVMTRKTKVLGKS